MGKGCTFSGGEAGKTPGLGVAVMLFWLNLDYISDYNPLHKYTCQKDQVLKRSLNNIFVSKRLEKKI